MSRWWAWRPGKLAPRRARKAVYQVARRALGEECAYMAMVCVAELVANAVEHGRGCVRVSLSVRPDGLLCAVRDDGPMSAWQDHPVPDPFASERGRGLPLVLGVADSVGVCSEGSGKVAWFSLRGGL